MAIEKVKVLTPLTAKYKGKVGISKNFMDTIATKWAEKLPDDATEEDITAFIEDHDYVFSAAVKEADSRVTNAIKLERQNAKDAIDGKKKPGETSEVVEETPEIPSDMPGYMKSVMQTLTALANEVKGIKEEKQTETIKDRFFKDERLSKVPEFMKSLALPKTEEEFEASVTGLVTNFTQFAKDSKINLAGNDAPPRAGASPGAGAAAGATGKEATKEELDEVSAAIGV